MTRILRDVRHFLLSTPWGPYPWGTVSQFFRSNTENNQYETYIVWFKQEYEVAGKAAELLNGQTIRQPCSRENITDVIGSRLSDFGYSASMIKGVIPVDEYLRLENQAGAVPNKADNYHTAAVFVPTMYGHEEWTEILHQPGFIESLTDNEAEEIFGRVMCGRSVGYAMLVKALSDSGMDDNDSFLLVPVPNIGGYDDIAYLMKDIEYGSTNFRENLERVVTEKTASWLYERNMGTITSTGALCFYFIDFIYSSRVVWNVWCCNRNIRNTIGGGVYRSKRNSFSNNCKVYFNCYPVVY